MMVKQLIINSKLNIENYLQILTISCMWFKERQTNRSELLFKSNRKLRAEIDETSQSQYSLRVTLSYLMTSQPASFPLRTAHCVFLERTHQRSLQLLTICIYFGGKQTQSPERQQLSFIYCEVPLFFKTTHIDMTHLLQNWNKFSSHYKEDGVTTSYNTSLKGRPNTHIKYCISYDPALNNL